MMLVNIPVELADMLVTIQRIQTEIYIKGSLEISKETWTAIATDVVSANSRLRKVLDTMHKITAKEQEETNNG